MYSKDEYVIVQTLKDAVIKQEITSTPIAPKKGGSKVVIMNPEAKAKTLAELRKVSNTINKCIATLSQNRINPVLLGSITALHQQINSVDGKLSNIHTKLVKSKLVKEKVEP